MFFHHTSVLSFFFDPELHLQTQDSVLLGSYIGLPNQYYCHLVLTIDSTFIFGQENILEKVLNLSGPLLKDSAMLDAVTQSKDLISMAEDRCREAEVSQFFSSRMCSPAYAIYSLFICFIFITYPRGLGESVLSLQKELPVSPRCSSGFLFNSFFCSAALMNHHETNTQLDNKKILSTLSHTCPRSKVSSKLETTVKHLRNSFIEHKRSRNIWGSRRNVFRFR